MKWLVSFAFHLVHLSRKWKQSLSVEGIKVPVTQCLLFYLQCWNVTSSTLVTYSWILHFKFTRWESQWILTVLSELRISCLGQKHLTWYGQGHSFWALRSQVGKRYSKTWYLQFECTCGCVCICVCMYYMYMRKISDKSHCIFMIMSLTATCNYKQKMLLFWRPEHRHGQSF